MEFKDRLKLLREEKGWSKTEVAKKLGISYSAYSNYEYGNREPNQEMTKRIANIYEVSVLYLLEGKKIHTELPIDEFKDKISKILDNNKLTKNEKMIEIQNQLEVNQLNLLKNSLYKLSAEDLSTEQVTFVGASLALVEHHKTDQNLFDILTSIMLEFINYSPTAEDKEIFSSSINRLVNKYDKFLDNLEQNS